MTNKISKFKFQIVIVAAALSSCLGFCSVSAAEFYFSLPIHPVIEGNEFEIEAFVNTDSDVLNAVKGEVRWPAEQLELESINTGNSLISFWVAEPKMTLTNPPQRSVVFSGLIPGGVSVEHGHLFTLTFKTLPGSGLSGGSRPAVITMTGLAALRNDGSGSAAPAFAKSLIINISPPPSDTPLPVKSAPIDVTAPEPFTPEVGRDPSIYNGQWFVVFVAADKGSSIDHYEIQETLALKPNARQWKRAANPYILQDQSRTSFIFVKAVDRAGNERVAMVAPLVPASRYTKFLFWCILLLSIIAVYLIWRFYGRKRKGFSPPAGFN